MPWLCETIAGHAVARWSPGCSGKSPGAAKGARYGNQGKSNGDGEEGTTMHGYLRGRTRVSHILTECPPWRNRVQAVAGVDANDQRLPAATWSRSGVARTAPTFGHRHFAKSRARFLSGLRKKQAAIGWRSLGAR